MKKYIYLIAFLFNETKHVKLLNYTRMIMNKIKVSFWQNVSLKILCNKMNTQKLIRSYISGQVSMYLILVLELALVAIQSRSTYSTTLNTK